MLKRKIEELEYQNKMLQENYKSSAQGEKQELLEKLALAEVRANDATGQLGIKDDEIMTLKKEIDNLRERVQETYMEKDKMAAEMDEKLQEAKAEIAAGKSSNEAYLREELDRAHDSIEKLEETVKALEGELDQKSKEARDTEAALKREIEAFKKAGQKVSPQREVEAMKMEYERQLQEKEQQRQKQKNEWAEVCFRTFITKS